MERKLAKGDYIPDGTGGLTVLSGSEEVLARVLYRLTARRGGFPFLPGLGSQLYRLGREKPAARRLLAARYVTEALQDESGLTVESVELNQTEGEGVLTVWLRWQGEELSVQVAV